MNSNIIGHKFITGNEFKLICDSFEKTKNLGIVKYTQLKDIPDHLKDVRKAMVERKALALFDKQRDTYGLDVIIYKNIILRYVDRSKSKGNKDN